MPKVLAAQEQAMMTALVKLLAVPVGSISKEDHITVLKCATVAEQCNLSAMLTFCESLIALHFATFASEEYAMSCVLSSAGILRVAQTSFKLQSGATEAMSQALSGHVKAAAEVAEASGDFIMGHALSRADSVHCPLCGKPIEPDFNPCSYDHVQHVHPTACSWPSVVYASEASLVTGVDLRIAHLQADMLTTAIKKIVIRP